MSTTTERYYLRTGYATDWTEVTKEQFIEAKLQAGKGHLATMDFHGRGIRGRVELAVGCELCNAVTTMTGTKRCDRCWELETRIQTDPQLARKILERIEGE